MTIAEASIITPPENYVKHENTRRQFRARRASISAQDIAPEILARSRHVAHCARKRQTVRVPAMSVSEWGQFLRGLELKRALA
ncbi:hypothetical protein EHW64_17890 [Erwinia psidii]|uniref:hypothetical protein n=1 Tax=Erwinia psidii TaxID=69224 RepID=UPI00226B1F82|nr:hypothetical protein [Erwinia psidii]MCX8959338.1 hypothetical protein [Erwinia psidii]MCX8962935.1 hypothetical protein [Erwinia psidii]